MYLRPFWTAQPGCAIPRDRFSLLWLKGMADRGHELWQAFKGRHGVVGLLLASRDVALRVTQGAKVDELQAQLAVFLGDGNRKFRQAVVGQRWWRLGPLTEAECWRAAELIRSTGFEPLRGELRFSRMGQLRHSVFFAAVGTPLWTTLDNGQRDSSEASLVEVGPPPASPRGVLQ